jgi:iron complex outermembrane receptor protein
MRDMSETVIGTGPRWARILAAGTSVLALAAAAGSAAAQQVVADPPPAGPRAAQVAQSSLGLEEIVVTARRKEENAQTVPIAITAISSETLEQRDIRSVNDLDKYVTGISICCQRNSTSFTAVRGVRGLLGYFAEVPVNSPILVSGMVGSHLYFDLGNVQAVKGPQGTLFGLSANAGVILYEPKRPVENFEGYVSGSVGNYQRTSLEGVLNVPVVPGKLLLRAGAQVYDQKGYLHDVTQNTDLGGEHYWNARLSAVFRPLDSVENYTLFNYYRFHNNGTSYRLRAVNPNGTALRVFPGLNQALIRQQELGYYDLLGSAVPGGTHVVEKKINLVNTTKWDVNDDIAVKNIFGYVSDYGYRRQSTDGTPFPILWQGMPGTTKPGPTVQYTEELQLQGKLFDRLSYTLGTFHLWTEDDLGTLYSTTLGSTAGARSRNRGITHALYGQATYDLSDFVEGLEFTGGYRYTWDERESSQIRYTAAGVRAAAFQAKAKFKAPSYTLSANYKLLPDTMVYVTNSKGYSSGGFNLTAPAQLQKYNPESLNNVEVGIKSDFSVAGMRARTNLSLYYGWVSDQQVTITQSVQTATGPVLATVTANAAEGHVRGLDAEVTLIPVESVELSGNIALVKGTYDKFNNGTRDLSGSSYIFTPKYKGSVTGTYHLPVDADRVGDIAVSTTWSFIGKSLTTSEIHVPDVGLMNVGPYNSLNADLDWRNVMGHQGVDASLFVTNIFNNKTNVGPLGAYNALGVWGDMVAPPQMYGLKLRYSF